MKKNAGRTFINASLWINLIILPIGIFLIIREQPIGIYIVVATVFLTIFEVLLGLVFEQIIDLLQDIKSNGKHRDEE